MSGPRAGDLVARMNAVSGAPPGTPAAVPELPAPAATSTRRSGGGRRRRSAGASGGIRYTVDLESSLHRGLHVWALDQGVDASEVIRTLIELLADPEVSQAVIERLTLES